MRRSGLAAALYVLLVFLSGAVVGIFGYRLYTARIVSASVSVPVLPKPADYRKKYVEEMTSRLHLTNDQVAQLGTILDDTRNRYHEEHNRSKQQLAQIHNDQVLKIHEILTPAQLPDYEKFRAEREKEREAREARDKSGKDRQPK
jgi:hypothetical protein